MSTRRSPSSPSVADPGAAPAGAGLATWPSIEHRVGDLARGKDVVEAGPNAGGRLGSRSYRRLTPDSASLRALLREAVVPGGESTADLLLCVDLLDRCWNDRAVVSGFSRLLRSDGALLVGTASRRSRRPPPSAPDDTGRVREYRPSHLAQLLSESFLEVRVDRIEGGEPGGGGALLGTARRPRAAASAPAFDPAAFWQRRLAAAPSLQGTGSSNLPLAWQRWLYRGKWRAYRRLLARGGVSIAGARVLDFGCGVGFFEDAWEAAGAARADGIDLAPEVVRQLQRRHPHRRYLLADLGATDEPPLEALQPAELVTAIDVLYHIVEDARLERTMSRLLGLVAPGGQFLFTESLRELRPPPPHVRFRPRNLWAAILADNGFRITDAEPVFVLNNHPVPGLRLLPALTGLLQHGADALALRIAPQLANNWALLCTRTAPGEP